MKKKKKEHLCISISYQGTMPVTGEHPGICRDDCMRVTLSKEGYPDILAYTIVNFPEIDGKKVLFIHEIFSCQSGKTGERMLLDAIMDIAENNQGKQGKGCCWMPLWILRKNGDIPVSVRIKGKHRNGF